MKKERKKIDFYFDFYLFVLLRLCSSVEMANQISPRQHHTPFSFSLFLLTFFTPPCLLFLFGLVLEQV